MEKEDVISMILGEVECILSTVDNGQSNSALVYYHFDAKKFKFYFASRNGTAKAKNISANGSASLVIRPPVSPYEVQSIGKAVILEDKGVTTGILAKLFEGLSRKHPELGFTPPVLAKADSPIIIIEYSPIEVKFIDATKTVKEVQLDFSSAVMQVYP